jgi:hypothetical protein
MQIPCLNFDGLGLEHVKPGRAFSKAKFCTLIRPLSWG